MAPAVRVAGRWTLPDGSKQIQFKITDTNGVARLKLPTSQIGTFRFCVVGLAKDGYTYVPAANRTGACKTVAVGP